MLLWADIRAHNNTDNLSGFAATGDYFTVPLHSTNGCLPLGLCKETVSGIWKMVGFLSESPLYIVWEEFPNLYLDPPITETAMFHNPRQSYSQQAETV